MSAADDAAALAADHEPAAIRRRLRVRPAESYLGDAVLGGIDGCVTTFAVVAGAVGGRFDDVVIVVLGVANLLADGVSMAVGNYLGVRVSREEVEAARAEEERHIRVVPHGERDEIRAIYAAKGFEGELLEQVVEAITRDRAVWTETMLREELGLQVEPRSPARAALATLAAFVAVGLVPLLPFLVPLVGDRFVASAVLTAAGFASVGAAKGLVLRRGIARSALETLVTGGAAATLAWAVGRVLAHAFGT